MASPNQIKVIDNRIDRILIRIEVSRCLSAIESLFFESWASLRAEQFEASKWQYIIQRNLDFMDTKHLYLKTEFKTILSNYPELEKASKLINDTLFAVYQRVLLLDEQGKKTEEESAASATQFDMISSQKFQAIGRILTWLRQSDSFMRKNDPSAIGVISPRLAGVNNA